MQIGSKIWLVLSLLLLGVSASFAQQTQRSISFFGEKFSFVGDMVSANTDLKSNSTVENYIATIDDEKLRNAVDFLKNFKSTSAINDWFFYQLIRQVAQQLSPKFANYEQYTITKWYLLNHTGYDARLALSEGRILLYVQSDDEIFRLPLLNIDGKQFVCLNVHDFKYWKQEQQKVELINQNVASNTTTFSYKISAIPGFSAEPYVEKNINFEMNGQQNEFLIKVGKGVSDMMVNYPVTNYDYYFNIPISTLTYNSVIPVLQQKMKGMNEADGIRYLLQFSRYAFAYEDDFQNFGNDKRLSPQQTLMYDYSDCDDRVALLYYLVKEMYNLPMIVLEYPDHVTLAVALNAEHEKPIKYKGTNYYVCEPTPQSTPLEIGELPKQLNNVAYNIAYEYHP